jgi:hypothetical protein
LAADESTAVKYRADSGLLAETAPFEVQKRDSHYVVPFGEFLGAGLRIKPIIIETGIMPLAREDYRLYPNNRQRCGFPSEYVFIAGSAAETR